MDGDVVADALVFLDGGGEMGALMRAHDWSATPLGPAQAWPQPLRTVVRVLLNTRHPMFVFWGATLACLYNDAYSASIGPERHPGALGQPGWDVWNKIWDTIGPQIGQVMSGGGATWHENHLVPITRHGRREDVYWTYSFSPIDEQAAASGVGGVLVICTETTAQVLAEQRQAERVAARTAERDRLARLFEQAPGFMAMLTGPDHRFELVNQAYLRLIGRRDVIGRTVAEALPDAVQQGYLDLLDGVFRSGQAFATRGAKFVPQATSGETTGVRFLDFVYQPIKDDGGHVTGIFVEGADVTDRTLAETALRELNETLEQRVAAESDARSRTEDALRQAQKMEAIGQLTGGIAHDFNNLLTGITGNLELLRLRAAQGRAAEFERHIEAGLASAYRAAALTHRLLAFSRRQTLDPKAIAANRLVAGMEDLFSRTVGPAIVVQTKLSGELWPTLCDPNQLESALLNLVINARDAMPDGGRLLIETANLVVDGHRVEHADLPAGEYVSVAVSDTGIGMSRDVVARAFDPFFTTKPLGQGTGLGLSMIYGFVQQSGGHLRLRSKAGEGTAATIYLARHLGAVDDENPAGATAAPQARARAVVLVVEDEPAVRMVIVDLLSDHGYTTLAAVDGRSGLEIVACEARIDLLLTDFGLPGGMDGGQLADAARKLRPGLKVLFITGYAEGATFREELADARTQFMMKPFQLDALAIKVQGIISAPSAGELPLDALAL